MSQYNPVTPTIQGQAMIAESLRTEEGLVFTKVEWGNGIVSRGEQYPTFTALKNKVIESPISKMERRDATLYITSVVNNSTLSTGFYCREIGVWAKIGANGTEQLFAYTYAENASYTPSSNQYNEKRIRIGLGVDANVNVTIKFNSEVYLTRQELEDHDADSAAHDAAFTAHNADTDAHPDKLVNLTTNGNSLRAVKGDGTNVDVVVPYAVGTTQANPKELGSYRNNDKISVIRDLFNSELADMNKKGCSVRFIRVGGHLTAIYNNWAKNWDATMGPWGTIYGVMSLLSDDTYANVELVGWTGTTVLLQRIAGDWKTAEKKVYTNGMLNVADSIKLQGIELTLDMGGGTQTNINIGQAPKNYSGSGFSYTFYNGKNSLADLVAKTISANVYGSYSYSYPINLAGKTIADFRSAIQSAMASASRGGKTIVVFTGDFSGILSNWANTTFSIVNGPTFSVEVSNIDSNYAHCKVYTYYNEEYHFYVSAGTWSAIDGNVLVSGLSQKVTTELAAHNADSSAHTAILNAHNADVNAHSPILNAIKAITGMSAYNIAPSKTIAEMIPLLGFGGIVAQKLENNGYVKFANGLTLQFGLTGDIPKNSTYQVNYPIAFTNLLYAGGFATINGDASSQDEIKMYNLPNQYNMTLLNTADNYTARTYWLAIGLI